MVLNWIKRRRKEKEFRKEQKRLRNRDLTESDEDLLEEYDTLEEDEEKDSLMKDFYKSTWSINITEIMKGVLIIYIGLMVFGTMQQTIEANYNSDEEYSTITSFSTFLYSPFIRIFDLAKPLIIIVGSMKILMGLIGSRFRLFRRPL